MAEEERSPRQRIPPHVVADIVQKFKKLRSTKGVPRGGEVPIMKACEMIGQEYDPPLSANTVWRLIDRMKPTTQAAALYLQSRSYKLALRLIKEADAAQSMDILTRFGALPPRKEEGNAAAGGFFISINAESCGAVKMGMIPVGGSGEAPADSLADGDIDIFEEQTHGIQVSTPIIDGEVTQRRLGTGAEDEHERRLQRLEVARQKLAALRAQGEAAGGTGRRRSGAGGEEDQGL